jgi:hypothetical protein
MEKTICTDRVGNEEVLQRVEQEGNILQTIKKGRLTGLVISCLCLLRQLTEGKIEGRMGRRGRRRNHQLDDLKIKKRGYRIMKEEALDRTLRRIRFGRGVGRVGSCPEPKTS